MKRLSPFILLVLICSVVQASQVPSFQNRINEIEAFYSQIDGIKSVITNFSHEVKSYTNEKMLDIDEKVKAGLVIRLNGMSDGLHVAGQKFNTLKLKKDLAQYQKSLVDRGIYTRYENETRDLEKYSHHSKRLRKYIERYKQGKYTQAQVDFMLMTAQEKKVAEDYSFKKDFLARESGMQESLTKQIHLDEKRINDMLVSMEGAVASVESIDQDLSNVKREFNQLQNEIAKTQLQFTVDPWKMGQFSCDSKHEPAQYMRFKHLPNMIMLGNLGNQKAVLKFNSANEAPEIVYSCKKKGQFGGCLDNTLRELCRLDNKCLVSLQLMEDSYDRNVFFKNVGLDLAQKLLLTKQKQLRDPARVNLIREYFKMNKVIHFSQDQFYDVYTEISNSIKNIKITNPADFLKQSKKIIAANHSKMLADLNRNSREYTTTKLEDTKRMLVYLHESLSSDLIHLTADDLIQDHVAASCPIAFDVTNTFCDSYKSMHTRAEIFTEIEPLDNLIAHQCPKVALRINDNIQSSNAGEECVECNIKKMSSSVIIELEKNLESILFR